MFIGRVIGYGTSEVKHRSLTGVKFALVQPLRAASSDPMLAMDQLGAAVGDMVLVSSDGDSARRAVRDPNSPARWTIIGIVDGEEAGTGLPEHVLRVGSASS